MKWRKLIYSIIIPSVVGFFFGIFISMGMLTKGIILLYGFIMMVAAFLSSTGKGKNGDALSTVTMGILTTGVTYIFISLVGELGEMFNWLFVVKTVGFILAISLVIYLAKTIMED